MGLFDFLGGSSKSKEAGTSKSQTDATKDEAQELISGKSSQKGTISAGQQQTTQSERQTGTIGQTSILSQLDAGSIALLQSLLGTAGAEAAQGGNAATTEIGNANRQLLDFISNRAAGGAQEIEAAIQAAQENARLDFQEGTQAQINVAAQNTGARLGNSFVQLLNQQGNRELATRLAGIEAQGRLAGRELITNELLSAAGLGTELQKTFAATGASSFENLARIAAVLKGAQATESGTQTRDLVSQLTGISETRAEEQTVLNEILEEIFANASDLSQSTDEQFEGVGKGSSRPGLLDIIGLFKD